MPYQAHSEIILQLSKSMGSPTYATIQEKQLTHTFSPSSTYLYFTNVPLKEFTYVFLVSITPAVPENPVRPMLFLSLMNSKTTFALPLLCLSQTKMRESLVNMCTIAAVCIYKPISCSLFTLDSSRTMQLFIEISFLFNSLTLG
jgi:hypothetical protein